MSPAAVAAMPPASTWRRGIATLIDFVLVPVVALGVMLVTGALEHAEAYSNGVPYLRIFLLGVAGYLLVNGWLLFRQGQTLGKRMLGIKIVILGTDEVPALWRLVMLRALFFPLMHAAFIGYWFLPLIDLVPALRRPRRCLHDFVAGTEVVAVA